MADKRIKPASSVVLLACTIMCKDKGSSVFDSLAKPVRKALAEIGFSEPTLPQIMAFPSILAGKNVLLIAPTGTGKNEAVLLLVFSKLVEQQEGKKGIQVSVHNSFESVEP